jgi:hypothetical protein
MDRGWLLLLRIATALAACAEAAAIVCALVVTALAKAHGFTLTDVLVAPINFVIFAGPPLIALGMANRARTAGAVLVGAVVAAVIAWGLLAMRALPWHWASMRAHPEDAETTLFLGVIFAGWPLAAIGVLVWWLLNRERNEETP